MGAEKCNGSRVIAWTVPISFAQGFLRPLFEEVVCSATLLFMSLAKARVSNGTDEPTG